MKTLEITASIQISKPPHEVFEAIVDPQKMTNYFISESTGRMEAGKKLVWRFPEFDEDAPVQVGEVVKDQSISFHWDTDGQAMQVQIKLAPTGNNATHVKITEGKMEANDAGIAWLKGNTEGWANFLACLKAYLEYGINLRKGAFDFLKPQAAQ